MSDKVICVRIPCPDRLSPKVISQLLVMLESSARQRLSTLYRQQARARTAALFAEADVYDHWCEGGFDRDAARRYLAADPSATDHEVIKALSLCSQGVVTAVRAELETINVR